MGSSCINEDLTCDRGHTGEDNILHWDNNIHKDEAIDLDPSLIPLTKINSSEKEDKWISQINIGEYLQYFGVEKNFFTQNLLVKRKGLFYLLKNSIKSWIYYEQHTQLKE